MAMLRSSSTIKFCWTRFLQPMHLTKPDDFLSEENSVFFCMIEPELTLIFQRHWEKLLLLEKFEFRREKIVPKCGGSGYKNKTFTAARHYVQKQSKARHYVQKQSEARHYYVQREQGTINKSSRTLDVQREKSLEKLPKKKLNIVSGEGGIFQNILFQSQGQFCLWKISNCLSLNIVMMQQWLWIRINSYQRYEGNLVWADGGE